MPAPKVQFSKVALIITMLVTLYMNLKNERWIKGDVISSDMNYYYIYLPAIFIYHDVTFNYLAGKVPEEVLKRSWTFTTEDGKHHVTKVSCGYAAMLMPFFLMAHGYELLTGKEAHGYSSSYTFAICIASFFYLALALFYQRKILLHFFDDVTSGITIIVLGLATNIYIYSTYFFSNAHIFGFCLLSIFVWKTIRWHQKPTYRDAAIIGFLFGLSILIRPTAILAVLFPVLYGINDKESFLQKVDLIKTYWKHLVVIALFVFVGIAPQLIIWKLQTEHFLYYSYTGERFYFNNTHIIKGLFSFRNGFFIYTPVMLLILPGFLIALKRKQQFSVTLPVFFAVTCFISYGWWCWWYGGSFGSRGMIESYALFALPLASTIQAAWQKSKFTKYALIVLLASFTFLNQFQSLQAQTSLLHYSFMSFETYKKIFGRLTFPQGWEESLVPPDVESALLGKEERDLNKTFPFLKGKLRATVIIKASNGKFLRTDSLTNGALTADVIAAQDAERFVLAMNEFGICSFSSTKYNKFINADLNLYGHLYVNGSEGWGCQQFSLVDLDNNKFAIRACNGKYIRPDPLNRDIFQTLDNTVVAEDAVEISAQ